MEGKEKKEIGKGREVEKNEENQNDLLKWCHWKSNNLQRLPSVFFQT